MTVTLTDRGATFAHVVNVRTYLADMSRLREYGEVLAKYLDGARPTARPSRCRAYTCGTPSSLGRRGGCGDGLVAGGQFSVGFIGIGDFCAL